MEGRYLWLLAAFVLFCLFVPGRKRRYKKTSYYRMTKYPYRSMMEDKGRFGEYQIYRKLASYEQKGAKLLFNCYLTKKSGETTEIDAVMLHHNGIYVFESKNYSGWIFGQETDRTWTQSLRGNSGTFRKERFLNPLLQNQSHITQIKRQLGCRAEVPVYSLVVFSDHCVLKKIRVSGPDRQVTTWRKLRRTVRKLIRKHPHALEAEKIAEFYERLYPYTQVSERERQEHIRNIQRHRKRRGMLSRIFSWLFGK